MPDWYLVVMIYLGSLQAARLELPMISKESCAYAVAHNQWNGEGSNVNINVTCEER